MNTCFIHPKHDKKVLQLSALTGNSKGRKFQNRAAGGHGDHGPVDKGCIGGIVCTEICLLPVNISGVGTCRSRLDEPGGSGNRTLTCCAGYTGLSPPELDTKFSIQ